jgi:hypothetical protein
VRPFLVRLRLHSDHTIEGGVIIYAIGEWDAHELAETLYPNHEIMSTSELFGLKAVRP